MLGRRHPPQPAIRSLPSAETLCTTKSQEAPACGDSDAAGLYRREITRAPGLERKIVLAFSLSFVSESARISKLKRFHFLQGSPLFIFFSAHACLSSPYRPSSSLSVYVFSLLLYQAPVRPVIVFFFSWGEHLAISKLQSPSLSCPNSNCKRAVIVSCLSIV